MTVHLVTGGARSGKSSFAQAKAKQLAAQHAENSLHYVATAIAFDDEMNQRIAHHKTRRGNDWVEHESPYELAQALRLFSQHDVVLVDCLTLWLNNILYNHGQLRSFAEIQSELNLLLCELQSAEADIIVVSNDVGLGVIPEGEISRIYAESSGLMNQSIAKISASVIFVAAGIPVALKGSL